MKFLIQIILSLFLFVQTAPTLLCLFDNDKSISINLVDEDENSKEEKEFKAEFIFVDKELTFLSQNMGSKSVNEEYLIKNYKVYSSLIIIPPKV